MFNLKEIISSIADVGQKIFKKKELKKNQYIRVNASKKDIFIFQE